MRRHLHVFALQLRVAALTLLQHRIDFVIDGVMGLFWSATAAVPLLVLFQTRRAVAGWSLPEALVVLGCFQVLKGVLDGAIQPSLRHVVEQIRDGTLDFTLIKPLDAQFMVSTSRFAIWRASDALGGLVMLGWALQRVGHRPSPSAVGLALLLLAAGLLILYSTWIIVVSAAFFVMNVDELSYLMTTIYDFGRWPASLFRGVLALVFTFVVPLALMTTYPALALLGRLDVAHAGLALAVAGVFGLVGRGIWVRALGHYVGAGG